MLGESSWAHATITEEAVEVLTLAVEMDAMITTLLHLQLLLIWPHC